MSHIPLEIWYKILQNLTKEDVKTISLVSQALHKEALSILFGYVELWFGCFPFIQESEPSVEPGWEPSQEEEVNSRSLDILLHISGNVTFAQAITRLRVIAPVRHAMVFERCEFMSHFFPHILAEPVSPIDHLSKALDNLNNLRQFEWIGDGFHTEIAKKLKTDLTSIYITQ